MTKCLFCDFETKALPKSIYLRQFVLHYMIQFTGEQKKKKQCTCTFGIFCLSLDTSTKTVTSPFNDSSQRLAEWVLN